MVAKAYRLLPAIRNTAVDHDELIRRNPCRIAGAGSETPDERPLLTMAEVMNLAEWVPDRFRPMILVATFGTPRYGDTSGMQRADLDLDAGTVFMRCSFTEVCGTGLVLGPPKSALVCGCISSGVVDGDLPTDSGGRVLRCAF